MASGKKTKQEIAAELAEFNTKYENVRGNIEGLAALSGTGAEDKNQWINLVRTAIYYDHVEMLRHFMRTGTYKETSEAANILTGNLLQNAVSAASLKSARCLLDYAKNSMPVHMFKKMMRDVVYHMIYNGSPYIYHAPEILKLFAEYGYDINEIQTDKDGNPDSVIHAAAKRGNYNLLYVIMNDKNFDIKKTIGTDGGYSFIAALLGGGWNQADQDIKIKLVQRILEEKDVLDLSKRPEDKPSLICRAIRNDFSNFTSFCLIKMLLKAGTPLEINDKEINSPMHAIAESKNDALQEYIKSYSGINCVAKLTASQERLFKAVRNNNVTDLKNELARGVDPNSIKNPLTHRITALHAAVLGCMGKDIVQTLLEAGADPNIRDINGLTPIELLKGLDYWEYYRRGKYNGIKIEEAKGLSGMETARDLIAMLIAAGSENPPNIRNIILNSSRSGKGNKMNDRIISDIVSMTVSAGYTVDIQGLLEACVQNKLPETAELLISAGADVNMPINAENKFSDRITIPGGFLNGVQVHSRYVDISGKSLVFEASGIGDLDMIKVLINNGADPTVEEYEGMSALDIFINHYPEQADRLKAILFNKSQKDNLATEDSNTLVSSAVDFNI